MGQSREKFCQVTAEINGSHFMPNSAMLVEQNGKNRHRYIVLPTV